MLSLQLKSQTTDGVVAGIAKQIASLRAIASDEYQRRDAALLAAEAATTAAQDAEQRAIRAEAVANSLNHIINPL